MSAAAPQTGAPLQPGWRRAARVLGWCVVFVCSALLGLVVHANAPALRRTVIEAIQRGLEGQLRGRVVLGELEQLGASRLTLRRVELRDPAGAPVLSLEGVQLSYGLWQLLGVWLGADRPIRVEHLRVERSHVTLTPDPETGKWTLERALESPRPPGAPGKPTRRAPTRILLPALELGELDLELQHPSVGQLQARVHRLRASAELAGADSRVEVQRFGLRLLAGDDVPISGTGSLRVLPNGYVASTFHGFVDGVEVDALATLDTPPPVDGHTGPATLSLRVEVPRLQPESVRRRLPGWPVASDVSARLHAHGPLGALQIEAQLSAAASRIDAKGEAAIGAQPRLRLELTAHALDARLFSPRAPETRLDARGELQLSASEAAGTLLRLEGETQPTTVLDVPVPASKFELKLGEQRELRVELGDRRGQLVLAAKARRTGELLLDVQGSQLDLARLPPLASGLGGRAELAAQATVSGDQLSGTLRARVSQLDAGALRAAEARVDGAYRGALSDLSNLELEAEWNARQLTLGPLTLSAARVTSRGALRQPSFDATLQTSAHGQGRLRGKLALAEPLRFRELHARWSDRELQLVADASYFAPEEGALRLTRLELSGAGQLRGSGRVEAGLVELSLDADALDPGRLLRAFGVPNAGFGGRISGHAALDTAPGAARGDVDLQLQKLVIRDLALGDLAIRATLREQQLEASVEGSKSPLGRIAARLNAELAGGVLQPRAWRQATGTGSVSWQELPLWPIGMALPKSAAVRELDGLLDVAVQLERAASSQLPSAFLQASTRELSFRLAPPGSTEEPRTFDQFTLHASASVDGLSGHGTGTVLLTDTHGSLVTSSGSLELDLERLLREPASASQQLLRAPLEVLLRLHQRPLSLLPPPLSLPEIPGSISGTARLGGSLAEPSLELALQGHDLLAAGGAGGQPLDVAGLLHFTPNTGELTGRAEATRGGKSLVSARLEGQLVNEASPLALEGWRPIELRAAAMLNGVPLELWPAAARERAEARLYGSIALQQRGAEQHQGAQIEIGGLSIQGQPLGNGRLTLDSSPAGTLAELQLGAGDRRLTARLRGAAAGPEGEAAGLEGTVNASNFEVASLSPLVGGILSRLGGSLDADARVRLSRADGGDWYLGIDGQATLEDASAQLDLFGLELRDLTAQIRARSTPEYTVLLIDSVAARSRSRNVNVQGDAELWLRGVQVTNGEARLQLSDVPVTVASTARGTVRGRVEGLLERKPDHMSLAVKIPELRLLLPAASTRSLISLEPNPDIRIRELTTPTPQRSADSLLWRLAFDLGPGVRVERADFILPLGGAPQLDYRDELRPSGTIEVRPGGRLTLFDRVFSVDHGVLQLDPEAPDNPWVDATASWRAPDGTTVYVDVTGRAQEATVLTRDDRGLQDVDRFYLLTGSPGPGVGSGAGPVARAGEGGDAALGQTFSLGINQLLRDSVGNVAVSVGATADARASYSASVRLSDRLTFQGSFRPASESQREENSTDLTGSLDYQISRRWSLLTELGTTGGAFDLLWSHRY